MNWYEMIDKYYKMGLYTEAQVKVFVPLYITQAECDKILGKA